MHKSTPPTFPFSLCKITTPLKITAWQLYLASHPDQAYAQYILDGIAHGFQIGYAYTASVTCNSATSNHPSANEHPDVISDGLQQEVKKGQLVGPLDSREYPYIHMSSLGAIPKKHSPDKWRLILDLSHPKGQSVNDGIDRSICSLSYMKADDVVQVLSLGRGTLLAKIDIKSAFRNVPVHSHDRHLLRIQWDGQLYVDTVLPFGLHSTPKIFNCIADAPQWIAKRRGISYLDHYWMTSSPPVPLNARNVARIYSH